MSSVLGARQPKMRSLRPSSLTCQRGSWQLELRFFRAARHVVILANANRFREYDECGSSAFPVPVAPLSQIDLRSRAMSESADALVIGAGLAGLVAANELVDAGRRVLLLDQEPE